MELNKYVLKLKCSYYRINLGRRYFVINWVKAVTKGSMTWSVYDNDDRMSKLQLNFTTAKISFTSEKFNDIYN